MRPLWRLAGVGGAATHGWLAGPSVQARARASSARGGRRDSRTGSGRPGSADGDPAGDSERARQSQAAASPPAPAQTHLERQALALGPDRFAAQANEGLERAARLEQVALAYEEAHAAMLAIQHSFIVDHYNCGNQLGDLKVNGAISQKYRGPVGIVGTHGYSKDYNYDDRLRYLAPPKFLDPVESAWHMQRQTAD